MLRYLPATLLTPRQSVAGYTGGTKLPTGIFAERTEVSHPDKIVRGEPLVQGQTGSKWPQALADTAHEPAAVKITCTPKNSVAAIKTTPKQPAVINDTNRKEHTTATSIPGLKCIPHGTPSAMKRSTAM